MCKGPIWFPIILFLEISGELRRIDQFSSVILLLVLAQVINYGWLILNKEQSLLWFQFWIRETAALLGKSMIS